MCKKLYYDSGELKYEGYTRTGNFGDEPSGLGTCYFLNGKKHMEGIFNDWFIEIGREYYETGALRYAGEYNKGTRTYYGPRYFTRGTLYREDGSIWFDGIFKVQHRGSIGYPSLKIPDIFFNGIEYDEAGNEILHDPNKTVNE